MALLLELISRYGVIFIFAWLLLQQIGIPIPAYPVLLVAGSLAADGKQLMAALLAAAVFACLLADTFWYAAGKRFGGRILRVLCKISLSPDSCVRQTESIFSRWGPKSLVVAKFVPGFASVATAMAGATGVPRLAFGLYDAMGAITWAGLGLALGWVFSDAVADVLGVLAAMGKWGLLLIAALLAAFVLVSAWRRYRFARQLRMDRISVDELAQMLAGAKPPVVVDVRLVLKADEGRIPGAIVFHDTDWPADLRAAAEDAEVVVYCACPNEASAVMVAKKLMQRGFKRVRPLDGGIDAWRAASLTLEYAEPGRAVSPAGKDLSA
jgi:membrane protein DedA with SNARE-associated domain/rhodanese-related sulfurtransferase